MNIEIRKMKNIIYWVATIVIMAGIIWGISFTVMGQSSEEDRFWDEYYYELETEYKASVREYMNEAGFANAGLTITHIVDGEGNREYSVKLHHSSLGYLEEDELAGILTDIEKLGFEDGKCKFNATCF